MATWGPRYSESLICLLDGFLALVGPLPQVELTCLFGAFWKCSISDPILRSTV